MRIATTLTRQLFDRGLMGQAAVFTENPVRMTGIDSEPEPDVAVYSHPDPRAYGSERSKPLLVVEVADSSLAYDLNVKAELYAEGGIPEYWVVELIDRRLVVFRDPLDGRYRFREAYGPAARVRPLAWPDIAAQVSEMLPEN